MLSRRYLQSHLPAFIVAFTVLYLCVVSVCAVPEDEIVILSPTSQNETDSSREHSQGSETDPATSNEADTGTESTATPALSTPLFSSTIEPETTDLPSSSASSAEKSTVTILPSSSSLPSVIITATKVTLGHRILPPPESITESNESSTETPLPAVEEVSTDAPSEIVAEESSPSKTVVPFLTESSSRISSNHEGSQHHAPGSQNNRQSRYHRYHDDNYAAAAEENEHKTDYPHYRNKDFHETSTEFYREMEVEGGDSYGDFAEDNDLAEHLPTPMALINPNGEGNNPPLEDDFAEAFKKVNSNGKRRRFRGGRRGKMKLKKLNDTNDNNSSSSTNTDQEENPSSGGKSNGSESSGLQPTTPSPSSASPKFKRYRSTTPNSFYGRTSTTTPSSFSTETPTEDSTNGPVVRNGPKPMILQSFNWDERNNVTPVPQIEKPGNGGHTEKISTYFFSTPSPSARLRLRQKIRESLPTSSSTTTTETPTESPSDSFTPENNNGWKNEFSDYPQSSFFKEVSPQTNFKIPEFVPINLGVESDDRQEPVENSLSRPDPAEKKTYSVSRHHQNVDSYDTSYLESSTTPKSQKMRRPTSESYSKHDSYDTQLSHVSPTDAGEMEKSIGSDYYGQGSNTEPSPTFTSPSHRPTTGSHYDRTKDQVIFFNDSPYSTQHSNAVGLAEIPKSSILETTPGTSSQTVGSHLSVSEGPNFYENPLSSMVTVDHNYPSDSDNNQIGIFARGQVYPAEDVPQLDSTYKNGPPDSSHIHSPNIVEHAQPQASPTDIPSDSEALQHLQHHPHHNDHQQGSYAQTFLEDSHHQSVGRPGGDTLYGTVEEVPSHNPASFEHLNPYRHHHMHPHPPPGHMPFPFGSDHPRSPPQHAPAMPYPPRNSFPFPPPPLQYGDHGLPTHPIPPPPLPPPPSNMNNYHPHHHTEIHNSFAPSYEMHSTDNHDHNNQHESHLITNHIAGNPSENSLPQGASHNYSPSHVESTQQHTDGHPSGTSSSPTAASPPDSLTSLNSNNAAPATDADPQTAFNGPPPPPPHMDHNFPPHSHTMATHPDYEPANPPLPHDHPFHNNFVPFPPQDILQQHENQGGHDGSNSISGTGSAGPYHPGIVESVPTGRPSSFEPSPLIPAKFTPIPDDVKETELFNSFATKPHEGSSQHEQTVDSHHEGPLSTNQGPDFHQNMQHHHHSNDQITSYLGPIEGDGHSSYQHNHHNLHPSSVGPSGNDHVNTEIDGYAGPVNEIHSGTYLPPNSIDSPNESYRDHHHNHGSHDHSLNGEGFTSIHNGNPGQDYKPGDYEGHDKPPQQDHGSDSNANGHAPHNIKSSILGGNDEKKEKKKQQAAFSNTPYVLMFPQLIPEEKMRPSPPSLLSKEIPVIQASSMNDFTTSSAEISPIAPGFKAVPVHPRHQMYQVLAKTHYEKMMERYRESKKKPPSAIYTPYGILVPVGTNVDAAASMNHNVFANPRHPPKFRGEKSLLNALLGSPSTNHGRFHPPVMSNRFTKLFEYEPAIDVLAEKLATKIVNAQKALSQKKSGNTEITEKSDGKSDDPVDKTLSPRTPSFNGSDKEDHMAMESNTHASIANPELKDYFKSVVKGHLTEMVETSVSVEDTRRPPTLSSKLLNSFFRKGRLGMNQPPQHNSPSSMPMQPSASMLMSNKVPPPPGLMTQPHSPHHHTGIGHPFPPPLLSQGPGGLLGTIRRLFSFAPPDQRYEIGLAPNFAGRTLYTNNGTHLPYIDGPSPRSSHFPPQIILPHPNMIHQYPPGQHLPPRIPIAPAPHQSLLSSSSSIHNNNGNGKSTSHSMSSAPSQKLSKKKRKPSQSQSSFSSKKSAAAEESKWQNHNRLASSSSSLSFSPSPKITFTTGSPQVRSTSTAKPKIVTNKSSVGYYHRNSSNSSSNLSAGSKQMLNKKSGFSSSNSATSYMSDNKSSSKVKGDSYHDSSSTKTEIVLNKRQGIQSTASASASSTDTKEQASNKPTKLDMFQTILGSTRSVLNYFKAAEARKSSGAAPTILEPRSATTTFTVEDSKSSSRKRRSPVPIST